MNADARNLQALFGLDGLRVAVTGASAGMGAETARVAAALGARVALLDIDAEGAATVADDIGGGAHALHLDLADEASCVAAFAAAADKLGGLDAVIHVAGIYPRVGLFDLTSEKWDRIHHVNARGTAFVIRETARILLAQGSGGSIVNISSNSAEKVAVNDHHAYASSKAAVNSLTRSAAYQLGPQGIRVNAISPGPMKTLAGAAIGGARATFRHSEANAPLRRNATLQAVGGAAVFLASDYGACTTGEIVHVDGGYHVLGMPQAGNL